jgi:hypothetical protein
MTSRRVAPPLVAFAALALLAVPARAQFSLGEQRAGTSSGTFLAIGIGARASGLGGSFVALANDPSAIFWNTAGLASVLKRDVLFSHVSWPGDVNYEHLAVVLPSRKLGGSLAFQIGALSTEIDETTSLQPYGTGITFTYSDFIAGAAYGRRWTDKLLVGAGLKYVREDLGSGVGGPVTNAMLFDIGGIYYLGLGSVRIGVSLSNFGPQLQPGGTYVSPTTGEERIYNSYDPPLQFRYGVAFELIDRASMRLTSATDFLLPADNSQQARTGLEWTWQRRLALRGGYDFTADALKLSAGAGFYADIGGAEAKVDYAYTTADALGEVHRISLGVSF